MAPVLALKVDVDTERGTRLGIPNLLADCREFGVPACFLFSLGPDNTGRAVRRVFRRGFLAKVSRTNVVSLYGWRTLLNGTLLPAPHIGRRLESVLRSVRDAGFEVGIHAYDHQRWQDHVLGMSRSDVRAEFARARDEFERVFGVRPQVAGAPGWQASAESRAAYDEADLLYASDTRGTTPFFPCFGGHTFRTLEVPTTLPTLDELLGRSEYPTDRIVPHYLSLLESGGPHVHTVHAELEGMGRRQIFRGLLQACRERGVTFQRLDAVAASALAARERIPICEVVRSPIDGRSGLVATQGQPLASRGVTAGKV